MPRFCVCECRPIPKFVACKKKGFDANITRILYAARSEDGLILTIRHGDNNLVQIGWHTNTGLYMINLWWKYLFVAFFWRACHVKRSFFVNHSDHSFHTVVIWFLSISKIFDLNFGESLVRTNTSTTGTAWWRNTSGDGRRTVIIKPPTEFVSFWHIGIYLQNMKMYIREWPKVSIAFYLHDRRTQWTQRTSTKIRQFYSFQYATIGCELASKSSLVFPQRVKLT